MLFEEAIYSGIFIKASFLKIKQQIRYFKLTISKKERNANICFNKRNGNLPDKNEYFDQ